MPNVLNNMQVVSDERLISSPFNGTATANVTLLIIKPKADTEDKIIIGCLISGINFLKLNFPRSVATYDSFTKKSTISDVIRKRTATNRNTASIDALAASTPPTAGPT